MTDTEVLTWGQYIAREPCPGFGRAWTPDGRLSRAALTALAPTMSD